jgi:hypothetical protein
MTVALDRLLAYTDGESRMQQDVEVSLDPPPIFYSDAPAILVVYIGNPDFQPVPGTGLKAAVNTNWDVLLETASGRYYLLNGEGWMVSNDPVRGEWVPAESLPADVSRLPGDQNWEDIRKSLPGKPSRPAPRVFVSLEPAELVLTDGKPKLAAVRGTDIAAVSNSDSDLFYLSGEGNYYLLVAGRWFRAASLSGPWSAATLDLPEVFASLPDNEEYGDVLASVPGTTQAQDAVMLASVPQRAAVNPAEMSATVSYQGAPAFEPIERTGVSFAVNTPEDVFLVNGVYYCCQQGVWFQSGSPEGPWSVCTSVPDALYSIPASHPKHNVTYVRVYNSTPETVVYGYTSGYTGAYVCNGLLLFGAGLRLGMVLGHHDHWRPYPWIWNPSFYSYGCRASYGWAHGGFYRGAACYGPWGGAGKGGYYNPLTGSWARGSYRHGPWGSGYRASAYSPRTGIFGSSSGSRGIYGSWQKGVIARDDRWVAGGRAEGWKGKVGWVAGSEGRGVLHYDTRKGSGAIIKGKNDTVFVGKDGEIYKRGDNGQWSKRGRKGWEKTPFRDGASGIVGTGKQKDKAFRPGSGAGIPGLQRPSGPPPGTKDIPRPSAGITRPATKDIPKPSGVTRPTTKDILRPSGVTRPATRDIPRPSPSIRPSIPKKSVLEGLARDANARARGNTNVQRYNRSLGGLGGGRSSGGGLFKGSSGFSKGGGGLSRGGFGGRFRR